MSWEDDYEGMCNLIVPVHESVPVFHESEKKMKNNLLVVMNHIPNLVNAIKASSSQFEVHSIDWENAIEALSTDQYTHILLISWEKDKSHWGKKDHKSFLNNLLPVNVKCCFTDEISLSDDFEKIFNFLES
jgi:hypothetical protein